MEIAVKVDEIVVVGALQQPHETEAFNNAATTHSISISYSHSLSTDFNNSLKLVHYRRMGTCCARKGY